MRYLVCPDSFKGSLSSREVGMAISEGIARVDSEAEICVCEMADGGEGTAEILASCFSGKRVDVKAVNPLGTPIETCYYACSIHDQCYALLDVASADGINMIPADSRDAMKASSFGVGMIIMEARRAGFKKFIIGLGGSASTDCGLGILAALGFRLLGHNGEILPGNGASMEALLTIENSEEIEGLYKDCSFTLLADVKNVLYGKQGAAYIYGPQKGASNTDIMALDQGLRNVADVIMRKTGRIVSSVPGGGAAGGIGGMFVGLFEAEIISGIDFLLENSDFMKFFSDSDIIITGEGRLDIQTLSGKVASGILKRGLEAGKRVIAIGGSVDVTAVAALYEAGFHRIITITPEGMPLSEAINPDVAKENIVSAITGHLLKSD